jgi:NTP pyrophosphatase (non-canonical NTP hydrolase)
MKKQKTIIERWDAEEWLGKNKDIWNHPRIMDRTDKESYELADLMAEFANYILNQRVK